MLTQYQWSHRYAHCVWIVITTIRVLVTDSLYDSARQLLQSSIDHVRHYLHSRGIPESFIPADSSSNNIGNNGNIMVMMMMTVINYGCLCSHHHPIIVYVHLTMVVMNSVLTMPSVTPPIPMALVVAIECC